MAGLDHAVRNAGLRAPVPRAGGGVSPGLGSALDPSTLCLRPHLMLVPVLATPAATVSLSFVDKDGNTTVVKDAAIGDSLLDVAHENGIDIEGACEGECACSTCHVILEDELFADLPEMSEAEEDMLDLAAGLTDTSRLACQVHVDAGFEGAVVRLPDEITNMLD